MERLTQEGRVFKGDQIFREIDKWSLAQCFNRLSSYEDTGLTPQEIMDGRLLTGWIPVEERLPEEGEEVLVSSVNGVIYVVEYDCDFGFDDVDAVAWMPLPEPYRPGEGD